MASNDGAVLTVFGLGYRQHDTRKMHRILDHYERLPNNANDRAALFATLKALAREVSTDEARSIENWLASGGDFPFQRVVRRHPIHSPPHPFADTAPQHSRMLTANNSWGGSRILGAREGEFDPILASEAPRVPQWGDEQPSSIPADNITWGGSRILGAREGEFDPILANEAPRERQWGDADIRMSGEQQEQNYVQAPESHHDRVNDPFTVNNPLNDNDVPAALSNFGPGDAPQVAGPSRDGPLQQGEGMHHPPRQVYDGLGRGNVGSGLLQWGDPTLERPRRSERVNPIQRREVNVGQRQPMGLYNGTAEFDMAGPGRRLGEEDEDVSPPDRYAVDPTEEQHFEAIFEDTPTHHYVEGEDEDEEYEEGDDEWNELEGGIDTRYYEGGAEQFASASDPPPDLPDIECEICCEECSASHFPEGKVTAVCRHETKVCFSCLETTISSQIAEGVLGQLNCPSCPQKLSYEDIEKYANPVVFQRYQYLVSRTDKEMFMCLRSNCGAGQIHKGGREQPMMVCNSCNFKICTYHGRGWHEGQTCAQFDVDPSQIERLEEEEATAKILAKDSRICPKCNQGVSKSEGCDHMLCRCGNAFCFICEAQWENIIRLGEYGHARTCPYNPQYVRKGKTQIEADGSRALIAVHGGAPSEELLQAKAAHQETRRAAMRPLAAEAAEKRMRDMQENRVAEPAAALPRKPKVNLKAPWEEGGHSRTPFGG